MTHRDAVLLSPYRPPTSYPVSLNPSEAEAWLNGWFALWHPAVLARLTRPPITAAAYDHDRPHEGAIYTVPTGPTVYQPDNWAEAVVAAGGAQFASTPDATETAKNLHAALAGLADPVPPELLDCPVETVRRFQAVGFGHLLIESLFDAMDHEHLLDAPAFWADVADAVNAAKQPDHAAAVREKLSAAVAKLRDARQVLNHSSLRLIDLAMPTRETLGGAWPASLAAGLPLSLIASGELLDALAVQHPHRLEELKARLAIETPNGVDVCCGSYADREDALLPPESQWWNLRAARDAVRRHFDAETAVYARKRSAYHPSLPSWLRHAGYANAVLVSFDAALTPARNAVVVNWSSPDGKSVDAYARAPLSAADPLTFFNLVYHFHQAFTTDSNPTVAFSHAGAPAAVGYAQLIALAELGDAAGEWTGLTRFLSDHHYGEYLGNTTGDDYFCDYLDERVTTLKRPDPVGGFAAHLRRRRKLDSAFALAALYRTLTPPGEKDAELLARLEAVEDEIEKAGVVSELPPGVGSVEEIEAAFAALLADRVQVRAVADRPGAMVFNPCNFTRRVALELDDFGGAVPVGESVKACEVEGITTRLVVDVPSLGFTWVPRGSTSVPPPKPRMVTADGTAVRNEFIEAEFDPVTGAIRAVRDTRARINRLGMQLVFNPGGKTKARSVTVTRAGAALGEVVCEGDILDEHDQPLCGFRQRLRAWVGRPVIELRIELDPKHPPVGYPWHAYYGARFAWRDPRAALFRGCQGANDRSTYTRPVSPDYLEARLGSERTFLFTGGLPFLQKHGDRMADAVLLPEGETARTFDLLIAFDREHPMQTAVGWTAPAPVVLTPKGPPHIGPTGWLAHVDLPSLLMTSLRPVPPGDGMGRAVAARLIECAGFGGSADLRFARDPDKAFHLDGDGVRGQEVSLNAGAVPVDFSANEAFRVTAEWA